MQVHETGTSQKRPQSPSYLQSQSSLNFTLEAYASAGTTLHQPDLLALVVNMLSKSAFAQSVSLGPPGSEGELQHFPASSHGCAIAVRVEEFKGYNYAYLI